MPNMDIHLLWLMISNLCYERVGCLVVLGLELEVSLGMCAHGAELRSLLAEVQVTAVAALPYAVAIA